MSTQLLQFAELSEEELIDAALPKLEHGDQLELHVRHRDGADQKVTLPPTASGMVATVLSHLMRGERVAILAEDQELSPNEAASILGLSRPSVVHRMDRGDLPFRFVGTHRRASLRDVLALKGALDGERAALDALAAETESLIRDHGL